MEATSAEPGRPIGLGVAAVASIGAGLIHAAAIGVHAEDVGLARLFIAAAVFQIGWGAVALSHPRRWVGLVGAIGSLVIVGGWFVTRIADLSWIAGLEAHEAPGFADTVCAALGLVAAGGGMFAWLVGDRQIQVPRLALSALAVSALAIPAVVAASSHHHDEAGHTHSAETADGVVATATDDGHDHVHTDEATVSGAASTETVTPTTVHAHDETAVEPAAATADTSGVTETTAAPHEHTAAVAPVPYDPTQPIDLGGVAGVTPEQQARAENLVAITLIELPQFADPAYAETQGFRSIGDGLTGHEHYINWSYVNDDHVLDPDYPESLVYAVDRASGTKTLVSAMFMLPDSYTLDTAPDIGGALTQWHIHDNLCFAPDANDPTKLRVVGITFGDPPTCTAGTKSTNPNAMIHVWITANPCGPFAALEGVAAGQVKAGEEHLCDSAHGAH